MTPDRRLLGERPRAWVVLGIGVLAVSAHSAFAFATSVLVKPMVADLGLTRTNFFEAMAIRVVVMMGVLPIAGQLTDRYGARRVLTAGAAILAAGIALLSQIGSLAEFYVVSALIAPGQACIGAVAASALVLRLFERHRGVAVGVLNGGDNLLNSAVPSAAALFLVGWGWRGALLGFAIAYALLGVLIALVLRPGEGRGDASALARKNEWSELPWGDRRLWLLLPAYFCIYAYVASVQMQFHAFQTDLGFTPEQAARLNGIFILTGAAGAPLFGWWAQRGSARRALRWIGFGLAASSVVLWGAASYAAFLAWAPLYGLVNGGAVAMLALVLAEVWGGERLGRLMGVAMVFCMSGAIAGNLAAARIHDLFGGYDLAWQGYTLLLLIALVPITLLSRDP